MAVHICLGVWVHICLGVWVHICLGVLLTVVDDPGLGQEGGQPCERDLSVDQHLQTVKSPANSQAKAVKRPWKIKERQWQGSGRSSKGSGNAREGS